MKIVKIRKTKQFMVIKATKEISKKINKNNIK